eukprot:scaffold6345_cov155-Amphora_coffeaeformis.AAC.1
MTSICKEEARPMAARNEMSRVAAAKSRSIQLSMAIVMGNVSSVSRHMVCDAGFLSGVKHLCRRVKIGSPDLGQL